MNHLQELTVGNQRCVNCEAPSHRNTENTIRGELEMGRAADQIAAGAGTLGNDLQK